MTRQSQFVRKLIFLGLIAALFIPISRLSATATTEDEGGVLSQMRKEQRLALAQLGKIDPASVSMSLATFGMRGVAANLLWTKAHNAQKKENFDGLMTALSQIAKLQPNFVSVWQHQAWNVSYNTSVEFDDYRHRYAWVKRGLDFLIEGTTYNQNEPLLLWDAGWFFAHKLGKSDEALQFRRLFRQDEPFHELLREVPVDIDRCRGPDSLPDNWKVAYEWFKDAEEAVESGASITRLATHYEIEGRKVIEKKNQPLRGKNPLVFFSDKPKALINYADNIERDGYLDEIAILAWRRAAQEWKEYGDRQIMTSWGIPIRLNDRQYRQTEAERLNKELAELLPGLEQQIKEERRQALPPEDAELLERDPTSLSPDESQRLAQIHDRLIVKPTEVAERAPPEIRAQARQMAQQLEEHSAQVDAIGRYQEIVNYENWKQRCEVEQQPYALAARKKTYEAERAFEEAQLEKARELFEQAWDHWSEYFENYPIFVDDVEGEIVVESIVKYKRLLDQLNEKFPPPGFKLMALIKSHDLEYPELVPPSESGPTTADPATAKNSEDVQENTVEGSSDSSSADGTASDDNPTGPTAAESNNSASEDET